jgi:hypothetical protein
LVQQQPPLRLLLPLSLLKMLLPLALLLLLLLLPLLLLLLPPLVLLRRQLLRRCGRQSHRRRLQLQLLHCLLHFLLMVPAVLWLGVR